MRTSRLSSRGINSRLKVKRYQLRYDPARDLFYLVTRVKDALAVEVTLLDAADKVLGRESHTAEFLEAHSQEVDNRSNKFNAKKTQVITDGGKIETLDSKLEADHYEALLIRQRAGEITGLQRQITYRLEMPSPKTGESVHICDYIADFVYTEHGAERVVDTKGWLGGTSGSLFSIKKRLMWTLLGIRVEVVKRDQVRRLRR